MAADTSQQRRRPNAAHGPSIMAQQCRLPAQLVIAVFLLLPVPAQAAEASTLLSISGDRIDYLETPDSQAPIDTIGRYYRQLPEATRLRLAQQQKTLASLLADYAFALNAADTAEMNSILSKVTAVWVRILGVHNDEFTDPARAHLRQLYGHVYPALAGH